MGWINREADAQRAHNVEAIAGNQRIETTRTGARDLVEKFDLAFRRVRSVNAHRSSQKRLISAGVGTKQLKELSRNGAGCLFAAIDDQMPVFGIDGPVCYDLGNFGNDAWLPSFGAGSMDMVMQSRHEGTDLLIHWS